MYDAPPVALQLGLGSTELDFQHAIFLVQVGDNPLLGTLELPGENGEQEVHEHRPFLRLEAVTPSCGSVYNEPVASQWGRDDRDFQPYALHGES
jgi:hypothetical protein